MHPLHDAVLSRACDVQMTAQGVAACPMLYLRSIAAYIPPRCVHASMLAAVIIAAQRPPASARPVKPGPGSNARGANRPPVQLGVAFPRRCQAGPLLKGREDCNPRTSPTSFGSLKAHVSGSTGHCSRDPNEIGGMQKYVIGCDGGTESLRVGVFNASGELEPLGVRDCMSLPHAGQFLFLLRPLPQVKPWPSPAAPTPPPFPTHHGRSSHPRTGGRPWAWPPDKPWQKQASAREMWQPSASTPPTAPSWPWTRKG
jgi:hypothetical protein